MEDLIERALTAKIETAAITTVNAAITEAGTQADKIVGTDPLPGSPEWEAEQDTDIPAQRQMAWQLACFRIQLAAGIDSTASVMSLRRFGATWSTIGRAAGMTRQSAHERWGRRVSDMLDPYGVGMPPMVPNDDPTALTINRVTNNRVTTDPAAAHLLSRPAQRAHARSRPDEPLRGVRF